MPAQSSLRRHAHRHGPAVVVRDLTIRYGHDDGVTAVDGLHLVAEAGEVLVILGPNGAGKTSTIEALEGYRRPTSGHISVLGLTRSAITGSWPLAWA